jgi:hypothetical protein
LNRVLATFLGKSEIDVEQKKIVFNLNPPVVTAKGMIQVLK